MRVSEASASALAGALGADGVGIDFGAVRVRIRAKVPAVAELLKTVYGAYVFEPADGLFDVSVCIRPVAGLRAWLRPQIELLCDGVRDFEPFPADTPLPLLEWGTNYAIATRLYCDLLLHAGVVERGGRAVVMPAMPGSGKSTLTAALSLRGFRLLSDEFGVIRLSDSQLVAMLRPVALKNASIDVIQAFAPHAVMGPRYPKTHKGTVAHLAPLAEHVDARHRPATPALVIFPRFDASAGVEFEAVPRARAFARLAVNSFNYDALGPDGFDALTALVQASSCWTLRYGDLDGAVRAIGDLLDRCAEHAAPHAEPAANTTA